VLEGQPYSLAEARTAAEKLIGALARPVALGAGEAAVGASIGIALHRVDDDLEAAQLLREADRQMYLAKQAGRGGIRPLP
jgi:GGDEF domain-containing protein